MKFYPSKLRIILSISVLSFLTGCATTNIGAKKAATDGLERFKVLLKGDTSHALTDANLSSSEIAGLQLGTPIMVYTISQSAIKNYQPEDGKKALFPIDQFVFPIKNNNTIISGEVVARNKGIWACRSYGQEQTLKYFQTITAANNVVDLPDLIHIPEFAIDFWGDSKADKYFMALLSSQKFHNIVPGNPVLIDEVMSKLKPFAK